MAATNPVSAYSLQLRLARFQKQQSPSYSLTHKILLALRDISFAPSDRRQPRHEDSQFPKPSQLVSAGCRQGPGTSSLKALPHGQFCFDELAAAVRVSSSGTYSLCGHLAWILRAVIWVVLRSLGRSKAQARTVSMQLC